MPRRTATIESLPEAFGMLKEMRADGPDWGTDCREAARQALAGIIRDRMAEDVDQWLDGPEGRGRGDRRNGTYRRRLLCGLGDIELEVPRTRRYCPTAVLGSYARRAREIDRVILAGFALGLSTRKVGEVLLPLLGRPVSPATVSRVARTLDAAVAAFHRRPLANRYKALMLDGVVLARKTGAGAVRRPVLVALGILPDGRKEIIDFQLARGESAAEWERLLTSLHRRGLTGEGLEVICADGGNGLLAALPLVYPDIPVQRCRAHKIRNILNKLRRHDHEDAKRGLHDIMNAPNITAARTAARRFADRWREPYPKAVECLRDDLEDLLTCFRYPTPDERRQVRTTNAIERRFREVRRRTRPMGTFQDRTSMERVLFAIFSYQNKNDRTAAPFAVTHKA